MDAAIPMGAIRSLSVDVANLTGRLALAQSTLEYLAQVAGGIAPDTWDKVMADDDAGHPEVQVTLRGDQVDAINRLLAAIESVG